MVNFKSKNQIIFTLFVFLLLSGSNIYAEDIYKGAVLSWIPSSISDVVGYKLYKGTSENDPFSLVPGIEPFLDSETGRIVCVAPELVCGSVYYFVFTAYTSAGIESDISNAVHVDCSSEDCEIAPLNVVGLRIVEE